jgi:hypothetical protein
MLARHVALRLLATCLSPLLHMLPDMSLAIMDEAPWHASVFGHVTCQRGQRHVSCQRGLEHVDPVVL